MASARLVEGPVSAAVTAEKVDRWYLPALSELTGIPPTQLGSMDYLQQRGRSRHASPLSRPHSWNGDLPARSLLHLGNDIYLCSPEFTFLQLSGLYNVIELSSIAMGKVVPAYQPKVTLALGDDAPILDPDRTAEKTKGAAGAKRGSHKRNGRGKQKVAPSGDRAATRTEGRTGQSRRSSSGGDGAKGEARRSGARKPRHQETRRGERRGVDEDTPAPKPFSGPRQYKRHPGDRGGH